MNKHTDVIIIGSGPAGYTAAIYTARARLSTEVENFPGFDTGILGPELMDRLEAQARRFGAELVPEDALAVDLSQAPFVVKTEADEYTARAVIIATGASARWLGLPNEQRLLGRGVSVCATCDGFFFRGKEVVVVGGGDTAMEEALFLAQFARQVTLLHLRATFRASAILLEQVQRHPKIRILPEREVVDLPGKESVVGVRVRHTATGEEQTLPVQGVFLAIGHHPNTDLFQGTLHLDPAGYIIPSAKTMTTIPGIFVAGDVADSHYRQAITAAADGARAAIDVRQWLERQSGVPPLPLERASPEGHPSVCC